MSMFLICASVVVSLAFLIGCGDDSPPRGSCTGNDGATNLSGDIDASSRYDVRDGFLDDEDGYLELSYGGRRLQISAEFNDPPRGDGDLGSYALPLESTDDGLVDHWFATGPGKPFQKGELVLERDDDRLAGTFTLQFDDTASVTCNFDVYAEYHDD